MRSWSARRRTGSMVGRIHEVTVPALPLNLIQRLVGLLIQRLEVLSSVGIERNSDTDRDRSGQGAGLEELCSLVL